MAVRSARAVTRFGLVERDEHRRFAEGTSWWWSSYPHLSSGSIGGISSILTQLPPEVPVRKCGRRGWSLRRQPLFFPPSSSSSFCCCTAMMLMLVLSPPLSSVPPYVSLSLSLSPLEPAHHITTQRGGLFFTADGCHIIF